MTAARRRSASIRLGAGLGTVAMTLIVAWVAPADQPRLTTVTATTVTTETRP